MEVRKLELPERFQAWGDFAILETPVSYRLVFGPGGPSRPDPDLDRSRAMRDFKAILVDYVREILGHTDDWRPLVVADHDVGFAEVVPGIATVPPEWGYPDIGTHLFVIECCAAPYRMTPGHSAPEKASTSLVERLRGLPECPAFLVDDRDFSKDDLAVVLETALTMARGGRQVIWAAYGGWVPRLLPCCFIAGVMPITTRQKLRPLTQTTLWKKHSNGHGPWKESDASHRHSVLSSPRY